MSLAFSLAPHLFRYRPYQQKSRLCRLLLGRSPLNSIERMSSMTSIDGGSVSNAVGITPRPFRTLYPRIQPFQTGHLEVSDIHSIYYEVSGNPSGLPVCFIHGGPGGGTVPAHRRFFDPQVYKIVLFDQRGCGKSTPFANIEQNTTWDLISDMERVREVADIDRWMLFGGSWGSTLAIAYAQLHPDRVIAMILRGIFLLRELELAWLYERRGAQMFYPEAFESYLNGLPEELRGADSLMQAYHEILSKEEDSNERTVAANAWSNWEHTLSSFPKPGEEDEEQKNSHGEDDNMAFARIENHFFINSGFFSEDGFLLKEEQMAKIRHIKTCIIQGRWDMVCPRISAYDLWRSFDKESVEIFIVDNAGHSTFEPGIEEALLDASDRYGKQFQLKINSNVPR